jgi:hypothetical protein
MDIVEYDAWIVNTLSIWMDKYPELSESSYEKVVYWKLESSHNVLIKRDRVFFKNVMPLLEDTWNKVLYYRKNLYKLPELQVIIDKRKKYKKFNTELKINNTEIFKNKIRFLYESFEIKKFEKKNIVLDSEYENCNFID